MLLLSGETFIYLSKKIIIMNADMGLESKIHAANRPEKYVRATVATMVYMRHGVKIALSARGQPNAKLLAVYNEFSRFFDNLAAIIQLYGYSAFSEANADTLAKECHAFIEDFYRAGHDPYAGT